MKPLSLMAVQTQFVVVAVTVTLPEPPAEPKSALFGVNAAEQVAREQGNGAGLQAV